jgi:hypothetical protein
MNHKLQRNQILDLYSLQIAFIFKIFYEKKIELIFRKTSCFFFSLQRLLIF